MSNHTYSQEIRDRIKANSDAAKKRLARLNDEYKVREQAKKIAEAHKPRRESFGEAVARIARESRVTI